MKRVLGPPCEGTSVEALLFCFSSRLTRWPRCWFIQTTGHLQWRQANVGLRLHKHSLRVQVVTVAAAAAKELRAKSLVCGSGTDGWLWLATAASFDLLTSLGLIVTQTVTHTCPSPGPNFHSVCQGSHSSSWSHSRIFSEGPWTSCSYDVENVCRLIWDSKSVEFMWRVSLIPCCPGIYIRGIKADQNSIDQFPWRRSHWDFINSISKPPIISLNPSSGSCWPLTGLHGCHSSVHLPIHPSGSSWLCFGGFGWCWSASQSSTGNQKLLEPSRRASESSRDLHCNTRQRNQTHTKHTSVWLAGGQHTVPSPWTSR